MTAALSDIDGLAGELAALQTEVRALEAIPAPTEGVAHSGVSTAQVAALSARIDGLDQRVRDIPADPAPILERLQSRVAGLEQELRDVASRPLVTADDVASATGAVSEALASLQSALEEADQALAARIDAVQTDLVAGLEQPPPIALIRLWSWPCQSGGCPRWPAVCC